MGGSFSASTKADNPGTEGEVGSEREEMEEEEGEEAVKGGEMGGEVTSSDPAARLGTEVLRGARRCTYTLSVVPSNSALGAAEDTPDPNEMSFSKCPPFSPYASATTCTLCPRRMATVMLSSEKPGRVTSRTTTVGSERSMESLAPEGSGRGSRTASGSRGVSLVYRKNTAA